MPGRLLALPTPPEGIDGAAHVRQRLIAAIDEAAGVTKRLHLETVPRALRERAADASTRLRALCAAARRFVDEEPENESDLLKVLGLLHALIEEGDDVIAAADLHAALERDAACWEQVQDRALAIGELASSSFIGYVINELRDPELLDRVERRVDVPLMHALMRAITSGLLHGRRHPVTDVDVGHRIDELLMKILKVHRPFKQDDPMVHLRLAAASSGALWNFTRIALRDDLTSAERAHYAKCRRAALRSIRSDVRHQQQVLAVLPDFDHGFDIGVALGTVEHVLKSQADFHRVEFPRRADAVAWTSLFYNVLPER